MTIEELEELEKRFFNCAKAQSDEKVRDAFIQCMYRVRLVIELIGG